MTLFDRLENDIQRFPSHGIGGAEYPYVLAGLIDEWGGEQVDYPERRHCCGFGFRRYRDAGTTAGA